MKVPKGLEHILKIDPEIMHGKLCFAGTRIPLTIFLDNLAIGMGTEEFVSNYPTVTKAQISAVLEWENSAIRNAAEIAMNR